MVNNIQGKIELMNRYVGNLYQKGRYEDAMDTATEAAALARQHLGEYHPDHATCLNNLAMLYESIGSSGRQQIQNGALLPTRTKDRLPDKGEGSAEEKQRSAPNHWTDTYCGVGI